MTSLLAAYIACGTIYFVACTYFQQDKITQHYDEKLPEVKASHLEQTGEPFPLSDRGLVVATMTLVGVAAITAWPFFATRRAVRAIRKARA